VSGDQKVQYILEVNKMRIIVIPERLDDLSRQMTQAASELRDLEGRLGRALGGLDWQVRQQANVEGQVHAARRQALALADEAGRLARFLTDRAAAFRQADAEGAQSLGDAVRPYITPPTPAPVPTPAPGQEETPAPPAFEEIIEALDNLLKPIDWISDSRQASRAFNEVLKNIGRMLNALTGQRGYVKMMTQLGDFLRDASKGIGFLSNILDVRDMQRYFSGQLTNAQIAEIAIKKLVSIPILKDRLAQWAVQNMVNPEGRWRGPVGTVE
jgi:hypothetical protein